MEQQALKEMQAMVDIIQFMDPFKDIAAFLR
jgi:hypothetical protein